jgi:hypothetical protein
MCLDIEQSLLSMNAHGNNTTICSPACYTQIHKTENLQWSMCTSRLDLWPYETACCYGRKFTCSRHWEYKFHQTSNMVHSHAAHVPHWVQSYWVCTLHMHLGWWFMWCCLPPTLLIACPWTLWSSLLITSTVEHQSNFKFSCVGMDIHHSTKKSLAGILCKLQAF